MREPLYIAVDLGAGSGRVFLGDFSGERLSLEEVHRFHYPPRQAAGLLRWDFSLIYEELLSGLAMAAQVATARGRTVRSLGIDTWGVDYGWIASDGRLLNDPVCYRDPRTEDAMTNIFKRASRQEIYSSTGIQFLPFNSIYQLSVDGFASSPEPGARFLLMPDLLGYRLTGTAVAEYSNATTTQLVHAENRNWDWSLIDRLGFHRELFPGIAKPGTTLGPLLPEVAKRTGLQEATVVLPATHDTGSAVAGAPLQSGWAYISSGTWSLVGVELAAPLINETTAAENFTNEGGVDATIRFLKNVAGLWLLESCRREWDAEGTGCGLDALLSAAADTEIGEALIYPDNPRFFNPLKMNQVIRGQLAESGFDRTYTPAALTRIILESLALRYASVLKRIEAMTGRRIEGVCVVGGGSLNEFLNQATANACGRKVVAGPVEATVIGNLLVQALAGERFMTINEARAFSSSVRKEYAPDSSRFPNFERYLDLERRYRI